MYDAGRRTIERNLGTIHRENHREGDTYWTPRTKRQETQRRNGEWHSRKLKLGSMATTALLMAPWTIPPWYCKRQGTKPTTGTSKLTELTPWIVPPWKFGAEFRDRRGHMFSYAL